MADEEERLRLIAQLASLLRENELPAEARDGGLALIAWLSRRMPGEGPSIVGVVEMQARTATCTTRAVR